MIDNVQLLLSGSFAINNIGRLRQINGLRQNRKKYTAKIPVEQFAGKKSFCEASISYLFHIKHL